MNVCKTYIILRMYSYRFELLICMFHV